MRERGQKNAVQGMKARSKRRGSVIRGGVGGEWLTLGILHQVSKSYTCAPSRLGPAPRHHCTTTSLEGNGWYLKMEIRRTWELSTLTKVVAHAHPILQNGRPTDCARCMPRPLFRNNIETIISQLTPSAAETTRSSPDFDGSPRCS